MKSIVNFNTDINLTFNQLVSIAKQLPEKDRVRLAAILVESDSNASKEEILDRIKQGLKEVKLYKEGKIKLKSAREYLNEL
jgi:phosphopantothenate synthetase